MVHVKVPMRRPFNMPSARVLASLTASLMLGACAQTADLLPSSDSLLASDTATSATATTQSDLQKATTYWGQEYAKKPHDLNAALSYAKNLKAMGESRRALSVVQQASVLHGNDTELNGEYGRLALEFDQVNLASKLLEAADDPSKPDWRIISARGTVMAKQGQYKAAIPYYERALTLSANQPSVVNNMAMAYAMSGDPKKAEDLLRSVASDDAGSSKVRQNLALVLGLQGKHDEAKMMASKDLPADSATQNSEYMRRLVRNEYKGDTKKVAAKGPAPKTFATKVAKALDAAPMKSTTIDTAAANDGWATHVATASAPQPSSSSSSQFKGAAQ